MNITVTIEIPEPLRALLTDLVAALRAAPPPAPAVAKAPAEVPAAPGGAAVLDVSLTSPAAASPPPASFPAHAAEGGGGRPTAAYRTPERIAYLTRAWPLGVSAADALAAMNKMPGAPVPNEKAVLNTVGRLGLKRAPEARRKMDLTKGAVMRAATATAEPVPATHATILHWGAEHGCRQDRLDLAAMNARRSQHGQPPFVLQRGT